MRQRLDQYTKWTDRLRVKLAADTERIQSAQVIARAIVNSNQRPAPMAGKLSELAGNITRIKKQIDVDGDALGARVVDLEKAHHAAVERARNLIQRQRDDVASLESEVSQLTNAFGGDNQG